MATKQPITKVDPLADKKPMPKGKRVKPAKNQPKSRAQGIMKDMLDPNC